MRLRLQPRLPERDYDWLQLVVDRGRCRSGRSDARPTARAAGRRSSSPTSRKTSVWPIRCSRSRSRGSRCHQPWRYRPADAFARARAAVALAAAVFAGGCATSSAYHAGQRAERRRTTTAPSWITRTPSARIPTIAPRARARARTPARLAGALLPRTPARAAERYEEALVEFQLASELNPTDADVEAALRDTRQKLRTRLAVSREGKTELQTLIERSRDLAPPGSSCRRASSCRSLVFRNASSRMVFMAIGRLADLNLIFDPGVPRRADHRRPAQHHARGRARVGHGEHAHVLPRHRAAHDHDRPRHAGQAPRVRRRGRPHVLPEQRRPQGSRSTCCASSSTSARSRRSPRPTRSRSRTRRSDRRRGAPDRGDRQGAARSRDRRRAARGRSHAAARVRPADRVSPAPHRASTARSTSTAPASRSQDLRNLTAGRRPPRRASRRCTTGCSRTTRTRARWPTRSCAPPRGSPRRRASARRCRCRSPPSRRSPPAASTSSRSRRSTTRTSA